MLSPRDRVVLAALAIRPGELMSAERLADALWGEHPPASWHKVVPGCIVRLRRLLGTAAIETTRYGYRLALPADVVDTQRFEQLQQRGRELLELGDTDRAQRAFGEALALWRGQPLMELDGWEPGRIEAERLTELRLEAEEGRWTPRCAPVGTPRCWRRRRPGWPSNPCGSGAGSCSRWPSTNPAGKATRCAPCTAPAPCWPPNSGSTPAHTSPGWSRRSCARTRRWWCRHPRPTRPPAALPRALLLRHRRRRDVLRP